MGIDSFEIQIIPIITFEGRALNSISIQWRSCQCEFIETSLSGTPFSHTTTIPIFSAYLLFLTHTSKCIVLRSGELERRELIISWTNTYTPNNVRLVNDTNVFTFYLCVLRVWRINGNNTCTCHKKRYGNDKYEQNAMEMHGIRCWKKLTTQELEV